MRLRDLFKMMYWSTRKDWRVCPHLLVILAGFAVNLARMRCLPLPRRRTVAIALVEHLGDIIAAEPVARFARQQYPDGHILWIARRPYTQIAARFASVDAVLPVTCLTEWLLLRAVGVGAPTWDLHLKGRYCPRCQIPALKSGPAATLDPANYYDFGNLLAVQCLSAGLPALTEGPRLPVAQDASAAIKQLDLPARYIVIHCASNEPNRDWPSQRWVQLLEAILRETGVAVIEIGLRPIVVTRNENRLRSLCGQLSIQQTAELIRGAALFIGIDSGPAHLANAVGAPGVILLGRYRGFVGHMPFSGPYATGENADIVRADGPMHSLPVTAVLAAARRRLDPTLSSQ